MSRSWCLPVLWLQKAHICMGCVPTGSAYIVQQTALGSPFQGQISAPELQAPTKPCIFRGRTGGWALQHSVQQKIWSRSCFLSSVEMEHGWQQRDWAASKLLASFSSFCVALQQQPVTQCPEISIQHRKDALQALGEILPKITGHHETIVLMLSTKEQFLSVGWRTSTIPPARRAAARTVHDRATMVVLFPSVLRRARCHQQAPSVTARLGCECHSQSTGWAASLGRAPQQQIAALHTKCIWEKTAQYFLRSMNSYIMGRFLSPFSSASYYLFVVSCSSMHSFLHTASQLVSSCICAVAFSAFLSH